MKTVRALLTAALALTVLLAGQSTASAAVPDPADDPNKVNLNYLTPLARNAYGDRPPVYDNGCHAGGSVTVASFCRYGAKTFTRTIVVFGDSHVTQWWAPLTQGAADKGWRVLWLTKSACPAADVSVRRWRTTSTYPECDQWRRSAIAKIRGLPRVDLVVMGSYSRYVILRRGTNTPISTYSGRRAAWLAGTERTVQQLIPEVRDIVIMRDTPQIHRDVPSCLRSTGGWTGPCSRDRSSALVLPMWGAEKEVDANHVKVHSADLNNNICGATKCRPVTSNRVLRYRDDNHLTVTFTRYLKPVVVSMMSKAML